MGRPQRAGLVPTQLAAALRREAIRQGVTLPTTPSLLTLISRWVNNHQQPNDFYRDQACKLGMEALTILHDVEHATGVQRVRDLRARLKPHGGQPAVADLTDQLLLVS